jgi:undecaprenyl-diphosphatase
MLTAALLGLLQALTEFLPISSSGHLRLAHAVAGLRVPDDLLFDIVLHVGTLVAVFWVYRERIKLLLGGLFSGARSFVAGDRAAAWSSEGFRTAILIVLATIPTGILGVLLSDVVASEAFGVQVVGALLVLNGVMLWTSRRLGPDVDEDAVDQVTLARALLIGVVQGLAVLPGISRAGSTIVVAMALGVGRMRAAEFSFFLSIPAIIGAVVLEFDPAVVASTSGGSGMYVVGALSAAFFGVLALRALLGVVRAARLHHFAWYCWALGVAAVVWGLL